MQWVAQPRHPKIGQYWAEGDEAKPTDPPEFIIHENDKQLTRDNFVEAVIAASNYSIRVQLGVCMGKAVKQDFPGKWPGVAEKVLMYLKSERSDTLLGALVCLHQLVKHFKYLQEGGREIIAE